MERAGNPTPNVLLMLSMALGRGGSCTWQRQAFGLGELESKHHQQVAAASAVADKGEPKVSTRRRAKVNRRRPHGTSLAARVFRSTI